MTDRLEEIRARVEGAQQCWVWSCSHCGPSLHNGPAWCDLGCGRDYSEMSMVLMTTFPLKSDTTDLLDRLERAEARVERLETASRVLRHRLMEWTRAPSASGSAIFKGGYMQAQDDVGLMLSHDAALETGEPHE